MVDERTRNRRGWLLFGLAILSLVLLFCTCNDSRMIQDDLLSRGQTGLESAGLDPELIQVAGRDVTLAGVVEDNEAKLAAGAAVAALPGVRLLNNTLQIADTAAPSGDLAAEPEAASDEARLVLELDEAEPSLSGNVDEATADLATDTLAPLTDETIQNDVDIQAAEATPEWFSGVIALAPDYAAQVEDGSLELTPERLTLNGLVPDEEARVELGETFSIAAGDSVNIVNQLQIVAAQAPTGLTFTIDEEPDGLNLSGEVSEAAATELSSALTPLGVNNTLELNDEVEDPAWLGAVAGLTPDFVESVDEANVSVTEDSITLEGVAPTEEERAAQVEAFEQAADGTQVTDNLQVLNAEADTQAQAAEPADSQAPSLSLLESGEGVTLSGTVAPTTNARTEQITGDFSGEVSTNLAAAENVSVPDWLSDLVGYLPTYSDSVQDAELELADNSLTLAGTVPSEAERDALEEAVNERVGDEVTINNELVVVESAPANFRLESSEAGTRLSGTLPQSAATALVDTLTPVSPDIRDDLDVSDVSTPAWLPQLIEGVPSYTDEAQDAVLELEGETLTLSGAVDSEDQKQALGERISELSNGEAEVINNLEVVEAVAEVEEPAEEVEEPAEAIAETPEEPADVEALEPELTEEPVVENPAAEDPAEPEAEPAEEPAEEPVVEAEPDVADPETSDPEPSDPEPSDPVEASEVSESPTPPSEPNLRVDVSSGAITLSGVVADDELKTNAAQGYAKTVNNTLELGTADEAILAPIIALGPDFAAQVERGSLNLQGDTLTLQGVVADEATRTALFEAASSAIGPDTEIINRLSIASSIPQTEDGK